MRFYLDTEFNGFRGELISLALVSEWVDDPRLYPGAKKDFSWYAARRIKAQPVEWVAHHVLPNVRAEFLSSYRFKVEFQDFIQAFPDMEVVCDWWEDAKHFCALLAGDDYASSLDFPCTIRILKTPKEGGPKSNLPHNALEDARALRTWHESLLKAA